MICEPWPYWGASGDSSAAYGWRSGRTCRSAGQERSFAGLVQLVRAMPVGRGLTRDDAVQLNQPGSGLVGLRDPQLSSQNIQVIGFPDDRGRLPLVCGEYLDQQFRLAAEVVQQAGPADAGPLCDVLHGGVVEASGAECLDTCLNIETYSYFWMRRGLRCPHPPTFGVLLVTGASFLTDAADLPDGLPGFMGGVDVPQPVVPPVLSRRSCGRRDGAPWTESSVDPGAVAVTTFQTGARRIAAAMSGHRPSCCPSGAPTGPGQTRRRVKRWLGLPL